MARFPKSEAEVAALSQAVITGLDANTDVYPTPPIHTDELGIRRAAYDTARSAAIAAQAAAEQATAEKDAKLAELVEGIKSDLRYAENTVDYDDEKLKLIGWAGRKPRTPLTAPGQTRLLEAKLQGEGTVTLTWRAPVGGGKPSAYRIMRRQRPEGPWSDVGTAVVTEIELTEQPRGIEYEYRVIAINKAGDGEPSNTVVVVL
jgi:hypothetical protein